MAISDAAKLGVYNEALRRLGERRLSSLTEAREPRRVLDDIWDGGSVVLFALEQGDWNFALRSQAVAFDPGIEPSFGFIKAIPKPADLRRLVALSSEPRLVRPMTARDYLEEAGYWFTDVDYVFCQYVSDDDDYGMDSAGWSQHFHRYLAAYLASEACERITNSERKRQGLDREMKDALRSARGRDAMDRGVKFPPMGSWVASRLGNRSGRE